MVDLCVQMLILTPLAGGRLSARLRASVALNSVTVLLHAIILITMIRD